MAWIEKRGGGFLVRWREGPARRSQLVGSLKDAEALRLEVEHGDYSELTLGAYARKALAQWNELAPSTRQRYASLLSCHLGQAANIPVAAVTEDDMRSLLGAMSAAGLKPKTVAGMRDLLARVYRQAVRTGVTPASPLAGVPRPKAGLHREVKPLDVNTVRALSQTIAPEYRVPVLVGAFAGLRIGEVGALRQQYVSDGEIRVVASVKVVASRRYIDSPKSRRSIRTVPIPVFLAQAIREHSQEYGVAPDGRLFRMRGTANLIDGQAMSRPFRVACRKLGLDEAVSFHTLRHSYASLLIREGAHPKVIQELLGHASITVTLDLYGHLFPGMGAEFVKQLDKVW